MAQSTLTRAGSAGSKAFPSWRRHGALLGVLLVGLTAAYWPTIQNMGRTWWVSSTYAHGWLVVPIVLYMIWQQRGRLERLTPEVQPLGLLVLFSLVLTWLLARAAEVMVAQQFAVTGMVVAMVYALLGSRVAWTIAFPLAYLFFAVPVGEGLVAPLQDLTAWVTVEGLKLTGLPVLLEGRHISIPTGDFLVAEACSGVRYLIASLALGCLYAYFSYRSVWRRLAFIALAGVLPIIANGLRAYGIVMLAYLTDHRLAVGVDHLIYGWLFFGLLIFLMFWIGTFWREAPVERADVAPGATDSGAVRSRWLVAVGFLSGVLVLLGPLAVMHMHAAPVPSGARFEAPAAVPGWIGPLATDDAWQPVYIGATAQFLARYQTPGGDDVALFGVIYRQQRQGHELIHFDNHLYDDEHWDYDGENRHTVMLTDGVSLTVNETRLRAGGDRRRVLWSWYRIGSAETVSPVVAKLLEAWERLRGGSQGSRLFALAADYDYTPEEARQRLRTLLTALARSPSGVAGLAVE